MCTIRWSYLTVPKPISRNGKLHWYERLRPPFVKATAVLKDILHNGLTTREGKELVEYYPLVMPTNNTLHLRENFVT